jgi:hypothetical protein
MKIDSAVILMLFGIKVHEMASFGFGNLRLVVLPQVYLIQGMAITIIKAFELTNTTARNPYL